MTTETHGGTDSQTDVPWSRLYEARRTIQQRYRKIWNVPIAKRYSKVLFEIGSDGVSVLEIGAGTKGLSKKIAKAWPNAVYKSLDIDRTQQHDFYSLEEVTGQYDLICMFDVVEHLKPGTAQHIWSRSREFLKQGGKLCATTPNIYHPPTYLRDATHITPWCYDELGALAIISGYRVEQIYRLYHAKLVGRLLHQVLLRPLHKAMEVDYAKHIMVVASN